MLTQAEALVEGWNRWRLCGVRRHPSHALHPKKMIVLYSSVVLSNNVVLYMHHFMGHSVKMKGVVVLTWHLFTP